MRHKPMSTNVRFKKIKISLLSRNSRLSGILPDLKERNQTKNEMSKKKSDRINNEKMNKTHLYMSHSMIIKIGTSCETFSTNFTF